MPSRRQLFSIVVTGVGVAPMVAWLARPNRETAHVSMSDSTFPIRKTNSQWQEELSPEQYRVLREHGTERAGTSPLNHETREGVYACAGCGHSLFSSEAKFESGTGWPSFTAPLEGAVGTTVDSSYFMVRTEVHCARCGGHLGHVFPDGPRPTGMRFCMNGAAMEFRAS